MKYLWLLAAGLACANVSVQAQKRKPGSAVKHTPARAAIAGSPSLDKGKAVYVQYCLSCHQADGGGVQNMNPPLVKTSYVLGDKARIIKIVLNGFNEKVDIDGDTYNNVMPAFNYLTDQQVADVLTYVRNSFTNKASAVNTVEVSKVRASIKK